MENFNPNIQDETQNETFEIEKAMYMYQAYPCLRNDISSYIDVIKRHVVGQDKAIKDLVYVAYYNQYINFLEEYMEKYQGKRKAMLMIAPTGTGKSTMLKALESTFEVPVYRANITAVTSAGYVGDKIESMLEGLLKRADGDVELAERGILLIDEIDKKIVSTSSERDVAGKAVQQELLKLFEDATVNISYGNSWQGAMSIGGKKVAFNTGKLTIILAGVCVGLNEIRKKRCSSKSKIGFLSSESDSKVVSEYTSEDLIEYGFIPELIGRIDVIEEFRTLEMQDFIDILYFSEESALQEAVNVLKSLGVEKIVIDSLIWERMIEESNIEVLGVRALNSMVEKLFMPVIFEAFRHTEAGGELNIDSDGNFELAYKKEGKIYKGSCMNFKMQLEEK